MASPLHYFLVHKPYGMLSQFTEEHNHPGLGRLFKFPKHVYPVGRLDRDSEGLLLLTNDRFVNNLLLNPTKGHSRTYWAQVEGLVSANALKELEAGVTIKAKGKTHFTLPAKAEKIAATLPDRDPPLNLRPNQPTSWIELTLTEGKNRQVRKMCAAVGLPCLRLVRISIENLSMGNLAPGQVIAVSRNTFYSKLRLNTSQ